MDGSEAIAGGIAPVTGLDLTGTWHLGDCLLTYANGKVQRPWASSASGYLIYSDNGHMCKSLNYPGRDGRIECISYCGEFEIKGDRVFHAIAVSADIRQIGTVLEQSVLIENNRLITSQTPAPAGGPGSVLAYIWNRADANPSTGTSTPRGLGGKNFISGI
jgi:hypothetical protein